MREKSDSDVGSTHPGGGAAPKGLAVRQLKRYVSWVQTVVPIWNRRLSRVIGIEKPTNIGEILALQPVTTVVE